MACMLVKNCLAKACFDTWGWSIHHRARATASPVFLCGTHAIPSMECTPIHTCSPSNSVSEWWMYLLICWSQNTIEENILRKSDQKRQLDWLAIQSGVRVEGARAGRGYNYFFLKGVWCGSAACPALLLASQLRSGLSRQLSLLQWMHALCMPWHCHCHPCRWIQHRLPPEDEPGGPAGRRRGRGWCGRGRTQRR
jgi:hypothetical protein